MIRWNTITARLNACHCTFLHTTLCGLLSTCGWRSVRAAVVWYEPRIANSRAPQRNVSFGSQGTVTHECYQGHATQSGSTQFNISCQANGTFTSAPSCLSVQCGTVSAVLFRRRVNSCEHNSCLPKRDKLQMLFWL